MPNENTGFTKFLVTTHRQNYLEPPRIRLSIKLCHHPYPRLLDP
ncbi:MAG: hypothetical protein ACRD18_17260 [Terriglobia bacterium]